MLYIKVASDLSYDYNEKIDVRYSITISVVTNRITTLAASAITVSIPEPEKVEVSELDMG